MWEISKTPLHAVLQGRWYWTGMDHLPNEIRRARRYGLVVYKARWHVWEEVSSGNMS
jgi:hypothetical protein